MVSEAARKAAAPVLDWLYGEGRKLMTRTTLFYAGFCHCLMDVGIPLDRSSLHIRQLHPLFSGRTLLWNSDAGGAVQLDRRHGVNQTTLFLKSPVKPIYEGGPPIRRKLEDPDCPIDFPVLSDLKPQNYTDYTIRPLVYASRNPMAISFCTRRPGGFGDADIELLDAVLPAFAAALELLETQRTARLLLDTYVGRKAGAQVLEGAIQRGHGQVIKAVIWFSDLRDFTKLSASRPLSEVIARLNLYFDLMTAAIEAEGGEILKFIGDAVLAIFPLTDSEDEEREQRRVALQALAAAEAALAALELHNARPECAALPLRGGIALHVGEVMYGNVGAADRLDFTVIGPAVNLAARLEGLTRDLEAPLVLSEALARLLERPLRSLGSWRLRGFASPQEAFTPETAG